MLSIYFISPYYPMWRRASHSFFQIPYSAVGKRRSVAGWMHQTALQRLIIIIIVGKKKECTSSWFPLLFSFSLLRSSRPALQFCLHSVGSDAALKPCGYQAFHSEVLATNIRVGYLKMGLLMKGPHRTTENE